MRRYIWYIAILLTVASLLLVGCKKAQVLKEESPEVRREKKVENTGGMAKEKETITITWLGHSAFLLEQDGGIKIVTDPPASSVGYPASSVEADVVTISHNHYDHNNIGMVKGDPETVKGEGEKSLKDIKFEGILSYHDELKGKKRGVNTIFTWEIAGVRFAHLGDFGQQEIDSEQLAKLKDVDVLLIPVGGTFTIDGDQAREIVNQVNPSIAIPMHYKTDACTINIAPVDRFLQGAEIVQNFAVHGVSKTTLSKDKLPEELEIWVFDYRHTAN